MEDFSQSRGDDDLFDDEIVPFDGPPSPENLPAQLDQASLETPSRPPSEETAVPPAMTAKTVPTSSDPTLPGFNHKPSGRGGHGSAKGGTSKKGGLADSKWATKPAQSTSTEPTAGDNSVRSLPKQADVPGEEKPTETAAQAPGSESNSTAQDPPSGPANTATNPRPPAVRGDRTATGGVRKPKLTEEELSAKLAAAKERSQNLAAAHARAQADAASFEERERIAKEKREKDRVERKVMDSEREKNRRRKMAVMGGREWDAGKNEEDFKITQNGRGAGRRFQSGMTPQQQFQAEEDDLKMYEWHGDRGGRGRGRGRERGGRGRGRGGISRGAVSDHDGDSTAQPQPNWSAEEDFPALPGSTMVTSQKKPSTSDAHASKPRPVRWDSAKGDGEGTWAEQVESSEVGDNASKPKGFW
ncbi:uncharacterized protein Z518_07297 [Rhinocladiella mackenziei CBS 650.93]|uniref:Uncharacterized protein n=1 Tax=Rhinocladiella mackenziei CBS 650.93 TaxID=1442369 RepID=A0A0D2ID22_9EURO|nr:uncharacterized protein Z518_07297 [Rhinocladiella mackenziei CBS 650.93]KIX03744.1 hypothetical protein Z518_07297 [Rhinocladiella mackenziei CBS 650.93]